MRKSAKNYETILPFSCCPLVFSPDKTTLFRSRIASSCAPYKYKTPLKHKIHPKIHPESSPKTKTQKKYEKLRKPPIFVHFSYFFRILVSGGGRGVFWGVFWRSELRGVLYSVGGTLTRRSRTLKGLVFLSPETEKKKAYTTTTERKSFGGLSQDFSGLKEKLSRPVVDTKTR